MSAMWRACRATRQHTIGVVTADASLVTRARAVAADVLRDDAALLQHSARSAAQAAELARRIPHSRGSEVVAAAWLHDIGYSPSLRRTGFHPLDGALYLIGQGWPDRVVRLVAHHSCASLEAPFFGVGHHLRVIEAVSGRDADILISADLASGPGDPAPPIEARIEAMRQADRESGLVPSEVCEERYSALREAHLRVEALLA